MPRAPDILIDGEKLFSVKLQMTLSRKYYGPVMFVMILRQMKYKFELVEHYQICMLLMDSIILIVISSS